MIICTLKILTCMQEQISKLQASIEPLRQKIIHHKLYKAINSIEDVQVFMQNHVFAVWDFMSLLKALQNELTCTTVPWFPKGDANTRYLINEIVTGEESDIDHEGNRKSHFELYLDAMHQCGADTESIDEFIEALKKGRSFTHATKIAPMSMAAVEFVFNTFQVIESKKSHVQSAVFTFGRENLIPDMFLSIVNDLHQKFPDQVSIFKYYLERHIEVDGDHHGKLALQMTANLCGTNETYWEETTEAVKEALQKRIELWDGTYEEMLEERERRLLD